MRRRLLPLVAATTVLVLALGGCSDNGNPAVDADGGAVDSVPATTATTAAVPRQAIDLTFTGDAVLGRHSSGSATGTLTYDGDEICLLGGTDQIGEVTEAHIHAGAAGSTGEIVVDFQLTIPPNSPFSSCVTVGAEGGVVFEDPANYYADLHTDAYPDGAVRTQLG